MPYLRDLPGKLSVPWVDLLKVDIEGSEWRALTDIIKDARGMLPFSQLQVP